MPPPSKVPPRRERWGWDRTEMGSRRFAPSNHGLHSLPAFIAMFDFSHVFLHAKLRFSALLTLEKPVSERMYAHAFPPGEGEILVRLQEVTMGYNKSYIASCFIITTYAEVTKLQEIHNIHVHVNTHEFSSPIFSFSHHRIYVVFFSVTL